MYVLLQVTVYFCLVKVCNFPLRILTTVINQSLLLSQVLENLDYQYHRDPIQKSSIVSFSDYKD